MIKWCLCSIEVFHEIFRDLHVSFHSFFPQNMTLCSHKCQNDYPKLIFNILLRTPKFLTQESALAENLLKQLNRTHFCHNLTCELQSASENQRLKLINANDSEAVCADPVLTVRTGSFCWFWTHSLPGSDWIKWPRVSSAPLQRDVRVCPGGSSPGPPEQTWRGWRHTLLNACVCVFFWSSPSWRTPPCSVSLRCSLKLDREVKEEEFPSASSAINGSSFAAAPSSGTSDGSDPFKHCPSPAEGPGPIPQLGPVLRKRTAGRFRLSF